MPRRSAIALATVTLLLSIAVPVAAQEAEALADAFPDQLGGSQLEVTIRSGSDWVAGYNRAVDVEAAVISRTESLLAGVEASLDDLTIATAQHVPSPDNIATLSAIQVRDTAAYELIDGTITLLLGDVISPQLEVVFAGGRDVLKVRDAEVPGAYPRTLVPAGDTLWIIEAEPPLLDEIVAALPPVAARSAPAFDLAASMPLELEDNQRVYLLVSSGWDFVIWRSENSPQELEDLALQSYLTSGIPIDAVTTISSVWVDRNGAVGAVLAGYQFAGADQDVLESILQNVILPTFEGPGSAREPGTLGGHDVTVLRDSGVVDDAGMPRPAYFFVSGDTIFALEETEAIAPAAIAALP